MAIALVGVVQNSADSTAGWNNGGLEGELFYQGSGSIGAKVGSGTTRFTHTGTQRNFSTGGANEGDHIIVILASLTPGSLDTRANGGLGIFAGNDTTNFGEWYVDGSDTKSPTTLFLPYIIDPTTDFDNANGSFTLAGNPSQLNVADTFGGRFDATSGIMGNFNNGLVDQITIGTGLRGTGVGGDLDEWITADEGTIGNRYGFLTTREGVVYFQGKMFFGNSSSSYIFSDNDRVIIFPDVPVASNFFEIVVENASSNITFDGFTVQAPGIPKVALTHISGTWNILNSTLDGIRVVTGGSGLAIEGTKISNSGQIDLNGMTLTGSSVIASTAASAVIVGASTDLDNVSDVLFDSNSGHSIEIQTPGTYNLDQLTFLGGGTDGSLTADIYNNSGGVVTLNVLNGGSTPTVRNGAGASTTINNSVTISLNNIISGSRLLVRAEQSVGSVAAGDILFNGVVSSDPQDIVFNYEGDLNIFVRVRNASSSPYYKTFETTGVITTSGFSATINQELDE